MAKFFARQREVRFYETFFEGVPHWSTDADLILPAVEIASEFGLGALDALHLCAAKQFDAEFVSAEKLTKPIYRAYSNVSSIYQD